MRNAIMKDNGADKYYTSAKTNKIIYKTIVYTLLVIFAVVLIFPYVFMVSKSLMTAEEAIRPNTVLLPAKTQWKNYAEILGDKGYISAFLHTMEVILFNGIAVPLSATFVAYGFARCKFVGKNFLFMFMLSTMMLPAVVTQISLYVFYSKINWINTLYPLTIPNLTGGGAIYIFLARSFIQSLPKDIDEAAKIDGAGPLRRYAVINLPLLKPVLIYIIINVFNAGWGDYYGPLIWRINDQFPDTLAYKVFYFITEGAVGNDKTNVRMAAGVVMSVVPAVLFFIFQKQLIEGVAMDGLKG